MQVILKRNFFDKGGVLWEAEGPSTPIEIPERLRDHLPKSAVIVEGKVPTPEAKPEPELRDYDVERATQEAADQKALETAGLAGATEEDQTKEEPTPVLDPDEPSVWELIGGGWYKDQHDHKERGGQLAPADKAAADERAAI